MIDSENTLVSMATNMVYNVWRKTDNRFDDVLVTKVICLNVSCGEKKDPMYYATKCSLTLSWHFQTPTMQNKLQWLKSILSTNLSRTRLRLLPRLMCNENDLIVEEHQ
ncbi:hypothetical protein AVEN_58726-1 [Araneus ventricosus]|uniref:Uncharacterized protein n=1 Tax=Araneus ventricosus TaxID=182803 RepID=A0A4Y2RDQ4_ARAVE|nr:hypothetical protein AVEN_58726-1 [Araneus ventricosus]